VDAGSVDVYSEITSEEFPGLIRDRGTIMAANVTNEIGDVTTLAVQITNSSLLLFDVQSGMEYQTLSGKFTLGTIKGNSVCLATQGGRVITLQVDVEQAKFIPR
jgi:hypothetical protein